MRWLKFMDRGVKGAVAKPVAIFRKKSEVLMAEMFGKVKIDESVKKSDVFIAADREEVLGFIAEEGSDYNIIEVKKIKDDPKAFYEIAFGGQ